MCLQISSQEKFKFSLTFLLFKQFPTEKETKSFMSNF